MATKLWSDWYDPVLPFLPGLPPGAPADFFIKRAAIEFLDRTLAWRVAIPDFNATAATPTYALAAPVAATLIAKVLELRFVGKELTHHTPEWLRGEYGTADWRAATQDPPLYWTSEFPNQVRLVPFPVTTTVNGLDGWCAVKPTDAATGVDDNIWREYHDDIANLAKAMAMAVPKKPYTDKEEAKRLRADLDSRIGSIGHQLERGSGRDPMRTKTYFI